MADQSQKSALYSGIAIAEVRAGDIVRLTRLGVEFDRRPVAGNPCTPENLVCVRSARAGDICEFVVNGEMP